MHKSIDLIVINLKVLLILRLSCCVCGHRPELDAEVRGSCTGSDQLVQTLAGAEFKTHMCVGVPVCDMEADNNSDGCTSAQKSVEEFISRTSAGSHSHAQPDSGALVLYSPKILEPFHLASRTFHLADREFSIKQNWADFGVAAVVWDAAVVLCEYLESENKAGNLTLKGKRVIELGAGTGLVGMVTAALHGETTVTDRKTVLDPLRENINLNFPPSPSTSSSSSPSAAKAKDPVIGEPSTCTGTEVKSQNSQMQSTSVKSPTVRALDWGENLQEFPEPFDIIVGADIVYIEESFQALLQTLTHLSSEETLLLLSCRIRYDRDTNFLKMLEGKFHVQEAFYDKERGIHVYSARKLSS